MPHPVEKRSDMESIRSVSYIPYSVYLLHVRIFLQAGWHGFGIWKHDRKLDYQTGMFQSWIFAGVFCLTGFWYYYYPDPK